MSDPHRPGGPGRTPNDASDREPGPSLRRQVEVTRPPTPADAHATHDRVLVSAFVAGDVEGAEEDRARRLVSTCAECAELASDLAAMASALRDLPSPVRTRDFRITPEQAAAMDRRGIRRFLDVGRPRLAFARPLGSGLAALGIAGLLLTSLGAAHPAMILSNVGSPIGGAAGAPRYAASAVPEAAATNGSDTSSNGGVAAPSAAASAAAAGSATADQSSPRAVPSAAASAAAAGATAGATPSPPSSAYDARGLGSIPPVSSPAPLPATSAAPARPPSTLTPATGGSPGLGKSAPGAGSASEGEVPLLPAASVVALLAGLGLLGADVVARRR
jgi:hypothetical protein